MVTTKKKRRKSRRAKRGTYVSTKTGLTCKFRSGWEEKYMRYLDISPHIFAWKYEPFPISYVSNQKTGKVRKYYPDFFLQTLSGEKEVIEIKPSRKVNKPNIMKKTLAARQWCKVHNFKFVIITEIELKTLDLL